MGREAGRKPGNSGCPGSQGGAHFKNKASVSEKSAAEEPRSGALVGRAVSGDLEESLLGGLEGGSRRAAGRGVNGCRGNGESECRLLFQEAWLGRKASVIKEGGCEVEGGCTELSAFLDERREWKERAGVGSEDTGEGEGTVEGEDCRPSQRDGI